jgi:hypothetical protein
MIELWLRDQDSPQARFVLEHGKLMSVHPKPGKKYSVIGLGGQCLQNAFDMVLTRKRLTYCEGFAQRDGIPVLHAWCIDRTGQVIDPTWGQDLKAEYFGMPFQSSYVSNIRSTCRMQVSMIHNHVMNFPLIRGVHPLEMALKREAECTAG